MEQAQGLIGKLQRTTEKVERFNTRFYIFPFALLGLVLATIGLGIAGVSAIAHGINGETITFGPESAIVLGLVLLFASLSLFAEALEFMGKGLERLSNWLDTRERPQN